MQKPITYEVIQFMKDIGVNRRRLYDWIKSTRNRFVQEVRYLGGNSVTVLNCLGENFANEKIDFSRAKLDNANFDEQDLSTLNFKEAEKR